jgi:hypothetical protein
MNDYGKFSYHQDTAKSRLFSAKIKKSKKIRGAPYAHASQKF